MDSIDKINAILELRGMTGAELERQIGVSNSVYSQWNTRATKPSVANLVKVADVLGVDVSELITDTKNPVVTKINALLAEKGISKQVFYSSCGITSASYSLWNTGKTQPRMKNLEIISEFLDVPVSYLLDGASVKTSPAENKKSPAPEGAELTPDQIKAIEKIKNMPPEELARKMAALEAVLDM